MFDESENAMIAY